MTEPPFKKRRTGGIKQRLAAVNREDAENYLGPTVSSELGNAMLQKWAWGILSPQDVQEYSAKACRDFEAMKVQPPCDLLFFSNMGTRGQYKPLGSDCEQMF